MGSEVKSKETQMKKINLLPHAAQKTKDVRRVAITIAAVQAAIFVSIVFLYVFFSMLETRQNREIASLTRQLRQNPQAQTQTGSIPEFLHESILTMDALENVQKAPSGVWIYAIRFDHGEISLTAHTSDILQIHLHIETLSEFFFDIRLGNLAAAEEGHYIYELNFSSR